MSMSSETYSEDDFSPSSSSGEDHSDYEAVYEGDDVDAESAVGRATAENKEVVGQHTASVWDDEIQPYQDEPLADAEWISAYRARRQKVIETNERMERCLARNDPEETW